VFSLFSPIDIRRTRDSSLENLETLILAVTSRLTVLRNHPSFPDPELAPGRHALNCLRVLTRILPYIYEADQLTDWEEKFFWGARRKKSTRAQVASDVLFDGARDDDIETQNKEEQEYEEARPLAEELLDIMIDLLFFTGFTIPRIPTAKNKVSYAIWQSGVGCKTSIGSSKELESNRCEVLRLLLTLTSKSMYLSSGMLPVEGVKAITYLATCPDKQIVLSVLCSLLNTVIKYNPAAWRVPYDHVVWKDPKQTLVIYSLQFLLVLLLYPVPEDGHGTSPKNCYRSWLGKLHRPEDFQFIAEGMSRILSLPMQTTSSYLPGSQKSVTWAPEMIMLFWETLQCNKRFRAFIIESNRAHDFVVLCLFYAMDSTRDSSKQGVVRMCIFVLQTLSVEPNFGKNLNKKFDAQETLPLIIRLTNFRGSYADYLIMSIHALITGSKGRLDAIYPALLAIINNIAAYVQHLSASASSKLLQLFASMSAPSFLLANEKNHVLLESLLESINAVVEHQYAENPNLVYAVLKSKKRVDALRAFTLESGQEELERVGRRRKEILNSTDGVRSPATSGSADHLSHRNPPSRQGSLSDVPEDGTFAIGDSEDDSDNGVIQHTPAQSSPSIRNSRASSVSSAEDSVPVQLRGMSEKARGKMPANARSFSRQSSTVSLGSHTPRAILSPTTSRGGFTPTTQWLESWLPELPLHTMLSLIRALGPHLPPSSSSSTADPTTPTRSSSSSTDPASTTTSTRQFLSHLPQTATHPLISSILASPSPTRTQTFEWSSLSLGWYESVLWSFIFASEMVVGSNAATSSAGGFIGGIAGGVGGAGPGSVGSVGVWNGTGIKLFMVKEGVKEGPTLMRPKGAVDAVGSRIVQGIGGLRLGERVLGTAVGAGGGGGGPVGQPAGVDSGGGGGTRTVREV
jgi:High-temperature-induced dauer-formation protein